MWVDSEEEGVDLFTRAWNDSAAVRARFYPVVFKRVTVAVAGRPRVRGLGTASATPARSAYDPTRLKKRNVRVRLTRLRRRRRPPAETDSTSVSTQQCCFLISS